MKQEKIDIVIPWVDDSDIVWQKDMYRFVQKKMHQQNKLYRDWGTLLYVLRGIEKFMPWINKVYLLTYGHIPDWIDINCKKLKIVRHEDFYRDKSCLPIFNSASIEMNISNIKNLSEKFIYFNDDTIVLKQTEISRFFIEDRPVDFLVQGIPRKGYLYRKFRSNDVHIDIVLNVLNCINSKFSKQELIKNRSNVFYNSKYGLFNTIKNKVSNLFSKYIWLELYHFPQPFCKRTLIEADCLFKEEMKITSKSRFRERNNLNQYLYRFIHLAKGDFEPQSFNDSYCMILDSYKSFIYNKNKIHENRFFCANDSVLISESDYLITKKGLIKELNKILPEKSQFEK